jgi:hypothetical protein
MSLFEYNTRPISYYSGKTGKKIKSVAAVTVQYLSKRLDFPTPLSPAEI